MNKNFAVILSLVAGLLTINAHADQMIADCVQTDSPVLGFGGDRVEYEFKVNRSDSGSLNVEVDMIDVSSSFAATKADFSADNNTLNLETSNFVMEISKTSQSTAAFSGEKTKPITCTISW
jgi:hypothetical protein